MVRGPHRLGVGLLEDRAHHGGDELLGPAGDLGLEVGRDVRAAPLPARPGEGRGDGVLEPWMGVGDDQLDTGETPTDQASQEAQPAGPVLAGDRLQAEDLPPTVCVLPADVRPDPQGGRLLVRLSRLADPRSNRALTGLCEALNQLEVCYARTSLRLVLEPPESHE